MDNSSAKLLNQSAARLEALRLAVKIMIVTLVRTGALPAEQFAQHLLLEAEKLPLLDVPGNELVALSQAARDQEIGSCIDIARQADAASPLAMRMPPAQ